MSDEKERRREIIRKQKKMMERTINSNGKIYRYKINARNKRDADAVATYYRNQKNLLARIRKETDGSFSVFTTPKPPKKPKKSGGLARFDSNIPRGAPLGYSSMKEYYDAQAASRAKRKPMYKPPKTIKRNGQRFTLAFSSYNEKTIREKTAKLPKNLKVRTVTNKRKDRFDFISVYTRKR
jgi:hypothetical protein